MRILLAEDDRAISGAVKKRLTAEGYAVDVCENGRDAYDYMQATAYDVVLMDIMMPGEDGLSVVRRARAQGMDTPILFLTARDSVDDRVTGLDAGGDDYLVKPFALSELLARIRVLARRGGTRRAASAIDVGDLHVDTASRQVTRAGRRIDLTAREYALLEILATHRDTVLSRDQIGEKLFSYDYMGASNMVDVYIRYLRRKIDDGYDVKLIKTVRGVGYVLREDA
ncbi:MAG TPA: response regulator transcription factor [Candidatus Onthenecus intestinigallinarum]|uniref:Stage 0 sporulation protein A homolog n=1 Tax=Candidatus Onthenecus intestinigallinarum TaxID=2840875 RepID=A0A9D1CRY9_9FIRM|nr:response regulator transcription factor [Candidatus Onthenecus intestinigallinarum]